MKVRRVGYYRAMVVKAEPEKGIESIRGSQDGSGGFVMQNPRKGLKVGLRLRDVERLEDGSFRLMVKGKTGPRAVIVIEGAQALAEWLRERPAYGPMDPEAPLFTTIRAPYGPLSPHAFRTHLRNLARRAGLKRHIYPHVLRHTRMTELARVLTEHELKVVAGWSRDSRMAAVYVHLSGRDAEAALRKAHEALRGQR